MILSLHGNDLETLGQKTGHARMARHFVQERDALVFHFHEDAHLGGTGPAGPAAALGLASLYNPAQGGSLPSGRQANGWPRLEDDRGLTSRA